MAGIMPKSSSQLKINLTVSLDMFFSKCFVWHCFASMDCCLYIMISEFVFLWVVVMYLYHWMLFVSLVLFCFWYFVWRFSLSLLVLSYSGLFVLLFYYIFCSEREKHGLNWYGGMEDQKEENEKNMTRVNYIKIFLIENTSFNFRIHCFSKLLPVYLLSVFYLNFI